MINSLDLFEALLKQGFLLTRRDPRWWPASGRYSVVIGALLTQQTRWEKVEKSLDNLDQSGLLELESLAASDVETIRELIRPSGFYNTKAERLLLLSQNILQQFSSYPKFTQEVERDWLLSQKGVGKETADSILCYGCYREDMVVDAYTTRLLNALGVGLDDYDAIQQWMLSGLQGKDKSLEKITGSDSRGIHYALYHGAIVEYAKTHSRGKEVDVSALGL